jgi:hypothetical protein
MLLGRSLLPAPNPQSFGYPGDSSAPWVARTASWDVVPETTGAGNDIRRLLESLPPEDAPGVGDRQRKQPQLLDSLAPDDAPTGSMPPPQLRGPITNAMMPRGAFP